MSMRSKKLLLAFLLLVWVLVAVGVWASMRTPATYAPTDDPAAASSALDRAPAMSTSMHLRLDLLDRAAVAPPPSRDLFSTAPLSATQAEDVAVAPASPAPAETVVGAQLRYMGFVDMGGQTIALLRDGPELYLARRGDRVGPGYLIARVDESFVEIEYRGARRRLPVYAPGNGTNGVPQ